MTRRPVAALRLAVASLVLAGGCASGGHYVSVETFQAGAPAPAGPYLIAEGDVLGIRVFGQESLSGSVRVRSDGKISLPFVNEHQAARLTPAALAGQLQAALKTFLVNPVVVVSLEERHPSQVSVLGAVVVPGLYPLRPGSGVLQLVALAGGLTRFADRDGIFVLRPNGLDRPGPRTTTRIRFTWKALVSGRGPAAAFELREGDVVVVE
ncbi:MAG: polysaccharide biosynthesis/export family protein [Deltaproteobacteria bacterium]|nr:polysaccharide biosynthesis/export family protein [Deltaproteobacteria bacterium]